MRCALRLCLRSPFLPLRRLLRLRARGLAVGFLWSDGVAFLHRVCSSRPSALSPLSFDSPLGAEGGFA
eukprot:5656828-Lingulodinium_polyedra.AAC.1